MKNNEMLEKISIINVKNKLKLKEICSMGDNIYVRCPFCNSLNSSMKLSISNNSYICKNCGESGYAVGLYAKCNYITTKQAYIQLVNHASDMKTKYKSSIITNTKKSEDEIDEIYQYFLKQLNLSDEHKIRLNKLGFSTEYINEIGFKTIPISEKIKVSICRKLISDGFELCGIPGFYQDNKFRWTFSSHKGILIPVYNNAKISSLRILLDDAYNADTTNIWFSSGNKLNGSKINNNIMLLLPEENKIQFLNDNKNKRDIIIASEILLAYKVHNEFKNNIVIRNTKLYL